MLKKGEIVKFIVKGKTSEYRVNETHLSQIGGLNSQIFNDLGLDKHKFAKQAYRYEDKGGDWPESKDKDFRALTRLVKALHKLTKQTHIPMIKPEKAKFVLQYELDEDPIEYFETVAQLKKRLIEITKDETLKRDSIYVFEVKSVKKIGIETKTIITGI